MPDIEGVPYESTGTALDQASAQALAVRGREWADAGISAANAAADRSVAAANESKALSQSVIAEVGTIRTSVAQAAASASASAAAASRAQSTSDALVPRMEQIETMAGLAPGEVTDAQTANLITQPSTATRDALNAAIAEIAPQATSRTGVLPGEATGLIAARLAFHTGDITVGIASDSTSDGATDWVRLWLAHMAERFPSLRIENNQWVDAQGAYGPTTVVQAGEGEPAFSGDILHDTFTRTGNLASPDSGGPWEVLSPEVWTLDGQTVKTTGSGRLRIGTGSRDVTSATTVNLNTTGTGTAQNLRLYHGSTNGVFVQITVNGGGLTTAYLYRLVNGTATEIINQRLDLALGVPVNGGTAPLTVTINGSIQNYTVTLGYGGKTWSHQFTITEPAYAAMEPYFALFPQSATPGMGITETTVAVADRPATYQTLRVWSGTKGGGTMDYQITNWENMFGDESGTPDTPVGTTDATFSDTFTRTGTLAGSTATTGQTWDGANVWTTDGTAAKASGAGSATVTLPGVSATSANVEVITTAPAAAETLRLGMRAVGNGVNGLYVGLGVSAAGAFTASAYVRTATGGFRDLGPVTGHGVTPNTAPAQAVNVSTTLSGLNVTVKVGAGTASYTITQAELDELGDAIEVQAATLTLAHFRVLDVQATYQVEVEGTPGTPGRPLDVMILAHGHNYGSMGPDQFIGKVEEFMAHVAARRPSTRILLSSQNPQFAPSANPPAHAARHLALRQYAQRNGIAYVPVFEHFAAQSDGGKSWVLADGVHPTTPTTPTPTPGKGSSEWGKVLAGTMIL